MSSKIESYQEAIRIIQDMSSGEISPQMIKDILLKIAETHPRVLVQAKNAIRAGDAQFGRLSAQTIESTINALLQAERRIHAIKFLRDVTGLGLREAKNEVDGYQRRLDIADAGNFGVPGNFGYATTKRVLGKT